MRLCKKFFLTCRAYYSGLMSLVAPPSSIGRTIPLIRMRAVLQVLIVRIFQAPDNGSCSAPPSLRPQHFHLSGNCNYYYVRYCRTAAIIISLVQRNCNYYVRYCRAVAIIIT
jgi:hypothetical protein